MMEQKLKTIWHTWPQPDAYRTLRERQRWHGQDDHGGDSGHWRLIDFGLDAGVDFEVAGGESYSS